MLKKAFVWGTVTCGVVAAYLMLKRGESLGTVAKKAGLHPVGSLVDELRGRHA